MKPSALIVCARKSKDLLGLQKSIERNVPRLFDLLPVLEAKSIAAGYNAGAQMECNVGWCGHHDILVFAHTDTEFWFTPAAWEDCVSLINHSSVGFVGVCGSRKLEYDGQQWPPSGFGSGGVRHRQVDVGCWYSSFGVFGQTLSLDGLFLACRREVFEQLGGFDEAYPGWHYYDVDITLRAYLAGFSNHTFPLLIEHGVENFQATDIEQWKKDRAVFMEKHGSMMPLVLQAREAVHHA